MDTIRESAEYNYETENDEHLCVEDEEYSTVQMTSSLGTFSVPGPNGKRYQPVLTDFDENSLTYFQRDQLAKVNPHVFAIKAQSPTRVCLLSLGLELLTLGMAGYSLYSGLFVVLAFAAVVTVFKLCYIKMNSEFVQLSSEYPDFVDSLSYFSELRMQKPFVSIRVENHLRGKYLYEKEEDYDIKYWNDWTKTSDLEPLAQSILLVKAELQLVFFDKESKAVFNLKESNLVNRCKVNNIRDQKNGAVAKASTHLQLANFVPKLVYRNSRLACLFNKYLIWACAGFNVYGLLTVLLSCLIKEVKINFIKVVSENPIDMSLNLKENSKNEFIKAKIEEKLRLSMKVNALNSKVDKPEYNSEKNADDKGKGSKRNSCEITSTNHTTNSTEDLTEHSKESTEREHLDDTSRDINSKKLKSNPDRKYIYIKSNSFMVKKDKPQDNDHFRDTQRIENYV